jgi:tyrosinase
MMYSALIFAAVAPAALASVIPTFEGPATSGFFDKRDDLTAAASGGKVLQSDILAGIALNKQKTYQAEQKPEQWKKCNAKNIVVRREWCVFMMSNRVPPA